MDDTICGATTRDGDPCKRPAGWGTDHVGEGRCKQHGGAEGSGAPKGRANGNADTLAWSELIREDYTEGEQRAADQFVEAVADTDSDRLAAEMASTSFIRYLRSGDPRHAAECRRTLAEFNVIENTDHVELDGLLADFRNDS
ncbi:MAG: HGGxSTG domain-containing protein [Haloarculaceae archaeon]|jgi:hypothetical protein